MYEIGAEIIEGTKKFNGLDANPRRTERMRDQSSSFECLLFQSDAVRGCKQGADNSQQFFTNSGALGAIRSPAVSANQGHQEMKMAALMNPAVFSGDEL